MTQPTWKRHLACALLVAAPVITGAGTALATPVDKPPPPAADVAKATALLLKGSDLFKAKKYIPALDHYKQSYALVPSPNSHLYIARCLGAIGETRQAWLEYEGTIVEARARGSAYDLTRDAATVERDELSAKVALVTVAVRGGDPAMTVRVGAYDVPPDRWGKPYPIEPSTVDVVVQVPGRGPIKQTVTVGPGERREVAVDTSAAGNGPLAGGQGGGQGGASGKSGVSGLRVGAFVGLGVGVVGFGMFAAGGILSRGTYSDLDALCGGKQGCPTGSRAAADQKISAGKTQQAIANAGLVMGLVGVAAGGTLLALSFRKKPSDSGQPTADLVLGPSWIGAQGSF